MAVASVAQTHDAEVLSRGTLGTRHADSDPRVRTLPATATPLVLVDDAGPWGSWLSRELTHKGPRGWVVAPALLPHKAGDRVHTDRRDAVHLARLRRAGDLTSVSVPQGEDEAIRDRTRAREEALSALQTATWRRNAFRLRHEMR